ncbi:MAG: bifunctional 4-hydroxy-2-oxoglutarate aldolase/2-dehydro-3-deoxy-phosphogluconate aldolase [Lachnospiraceae bacterium]|nr:bifunctional 4-hydroxy-2-oxoglutarate aldolase/2-dehydro-3-deoxy-phosphogluconate aldolase [Lachnospiraceae bacterium]
MNHTLELIRKTGIVPVVVLDDAKDAKALGQALVEGGLPCAEVTFRTAAAEEAIRIMAREFPDLLVGAGTVLTMDQAKRAVDAGAKFMVSPGFDPQIVDFCLEKGITITPGVATPTEIIMAMNKGLNVVKFFPAEPLGGLKMIKAIAAAFPEISFMPTGGISAKNVGEYLAYDRIAACGGSWMVKKDLIRAGKFDEITAMVKEAAGIVREIRG